MRVAHLTTHLNTGGIPIYIYTLANALRPLHASQIVISSGGSMEPSFHDRGIPTFQFNLHTKFEFHLKLFLALPAIIRLLKKERIELIHAHTRVTQVLAVIISKLTGIPFISTAHGFFKPRFGRRLFPAWGSRVIAISDPVRTNLIDEHHIDAKRVVKIRNGIQIERFSQASNPSFQAAARKEWGVSPDQFVVAMVSRMIYEKGPEDLLHAVAQLHGKYPKLRIFLVGDGPDKAELEKKAATLGVLNCVKFTGNISRVESILGACNAFVHPVRVPEGFGLSIAEAMAAGLPIIVTNQWALLQSIMKDKEVGAIIEKERPDQIAAVILNWIENPSAMTEACQNNSKIAREYFDIRQMALDVFAIYQDVLKKPHGVPD